MGYIYRVATIFWCVGVKVGGNARKRFETPSQARSQFLAVSGCNRRPGLGLGLEILILLVQRNRDALRKTALYKSNIDIDTVPIKKYDF